MIYNVSLDEGNLGDKICLLAACYNHLIDREDTCFVDFMSKEAVEMFGIERLKHGKHPKGESVLVKAPQAESRKHDRGDWPVEHPYYAMYVCALGRAIGENLSLVRPFNLPTIETLISNRRIVVQLRSITAANVSDCVVQKIIDKVVETTGEKIYAVGRTNTPRTVKNVDYSMLEDSEASFIKNIASAKLVICPRSGGLHIAQAYSRPTICWNVIDGEDWHCGKWDKLIQVPIDLYPDPLQNIDLDSIPENPIPLPITSLVFENRPDFWPRIDKIARWHRKWFRFGREIIVSNKNPGIPGMTFINSGDPPLGDMWLKMWYSDMCVHWLSKLCKTSHLLIWQWDGFILNSHRWRDDFLQWDYIGAPEGGIWIQIAFWLESILQKWHNPCRILGNHIEITGNGGFSLRTNKFLECSDRLSRTGMTCKAEDVYLCIERRKELEDMGVKFCPSNLARDFSNGDFNRTFGFHSPNLLWDAKTYLEGKYLINPRANRQELPVANVSA